MGLRHDLSSPKLGLEPKFHYPGTFGGFGKREQTNKQTRFMFYKYRYHVYNHLLVKDYVGNNSKGTYDYLNIYRYVFQECFILSLSFRNSTISKIEWIIESVETDMVWHRKET